MNRIVTALLLSLALSPAAFAASSASHTVTVTVEAINEIAITGNATLTIDSADATGAYADATDATSSLSWTTNEATKKIVVATDRVSSSYELKVEATGVTGGTGAGQVTITDTPVDLVTGISNTNGGCTLNYTASADAADAVGSEVHTVTYTITG